VQPALTDRTAVEMHLFDAFIPAAYRRPDHAGRWTALAAETWLGFLARHLENTIDSPDLAWWQLLLSVPLAELRFVFGVTLGVAVGVPAGAAVGVATGVTVGTGVGVAAGLAAGVAVGVTILVSFIKMADSRFLSVEQTTPSHGVRPDAKARKVWILAGVAGCVLLGVPGGIFGTAESGIAVGVTGGVVLGIVGGAAGVVLGIAMQLTGVPGDLTTAMNPAAVLAHDRRSALVLALGVGVTVGVIAGLVAGIGYPVAVGLAAGAASGVVLGFVSSAAGTGWPSYMIVRGWLALRHRLPWSLMTFLADAHQRGVLRQAGAVYQFRHIELQHRLAKAEERHAVLAEDDPPN
jgi:hypothetical protein